MRAVILAGGTATRLRKLTKNLPKCLLHIKGMAIIDWQIKSLLEAGVKEIIIITGYQSKRLKQHLESFHKNVDLKFLHNEKFETTSPAYGLWLARNYFDEEIIYLNGDLMCESKIIKKIVSSKHPSTTAIQRNSWDEEQVKISTENNKTVSRLSKQTKEKESFGEFIGATKMSTDFLKSLTEVIEETIETDSKKRFAADAISKTVERGHKLFITDVTKLKAIEIDTVEDYQAAKLKWKNPFIKRLLTLLDITMAWIFFIISHLVPKDKKRVSIIGWHNSGDGEIFADNSKYLFLEISNNNPKINVAWIARDKRLKSQLEEAGYKSFAHNSLKGIWHALRSKFTIIDAFMKTENWRFSGGSKVIQLWHGKGFKKSGFSSTTGIKNYNKFVSPYVYTKYNKVISSSSYTQKMMAAIFRTDKNKVLVTGLPRNDVLYKKIEGAQIGTDPKIKDLLIKVRKNNNKIILFAPTFRNDSSNPVDQLDLGKLNDFLLGMRAHMVISLHPKLYNRIYFMGENYSNIDFVEPGYDLYPFLNQFDMLVSDYGSLFVDYILLNRPLVFFTYDLEEYKKDPGLYEDFDRLTPGPHPKNFSEFLNSLKQTDGEFAKEREEVLNIFQKYKNGNSAKRIFESINDISEKSPK